MNGSDRDRALRRTRIDSLDAERLTHLLGQLGHEVGTPLGSILMMSEMLADGGDSGDAARYAEGIRTAALDLRAVVQGFVRLVRLRTGWISPTAGRVDAEHFSGDAAAALRALPGIEVETRIDAGAGDLETGLETDAVFLREIVERLGAWVSQVADRGTARLTIDDEGLRIVLDLDLGAAGGRPPWDEPALLDPLATGDLELSRRFGGKGLELALVCALAERLGGRAWGQSGAAGSRIRFEVSVPARLDDPLAAPNG